jgi:hypothetical protein
VPRCTPVWPGCAPQAADARLKKDTLVPAMMRWDGQFSDRMLEIIDWCLNLNHLYRPQSVFALQKALVEAVTPPAPKVNPNWLGRFVDKFRKADQMRFTIYQESRQGGRANNEDRTTTATRAMRC